MNNKGFAISGVLYSLLVLFITLFMGILIVLATSKFSFDKIKNDVKNNLEASIYKEDILNGADPELKGLIPVTIEPNGTVRKADVTEKWYEYKNKEWANAVVLNDKNIVYNNGDIIPEDRIEQYYVWIPRYKYKLWYTEATDSFTNLDSSKVHSIDIVFENKRTAKSEGITNGTYLTHPAFTFGTDELNGIWVGKFETGYKGATTKEEAQVSTPDSSKVIIKPNTYAWTIMSVSNMFITSRGISSTFNLNTNSNSHMMKNTEWGAVAYLSHSKYGKDSEIYINNNSNVITGCGGNTASESSTSNCLNVYGSKSNNIYNQSTTGNISGIFDMSGGSAEYVMGYTTGATTKYSASGFIEETFPENKYIDIYSSSINNQYSKRKLGDATGEMGPFPDLSSSWYGDCAYFIEANNPWMYRSGTYSNTTIAGLFFYHGFTGDVLGDTSFRIVIN